MAVCEPATHDDSSSQQAEARPMPATLKSVAPPNSSRRQSMDSFQSSREAVELHHQLEVARQEARVLRAQCIQYQRKLTDIVGEKELLNRELETNSQAQNAVVGGLQEQISLLRHDLHTQNKDIVTLFQLLDSDFEHQDNAAGNLKQIFCKVETLVNQNKDLHIQQKRVAIMSANSQLGDAEVPKILQNSEDEQKVQLQQRLAEAEFAKEQSEKGLEKEKETRSLALAAAFASKEAAVGQLQQQLRELEAIAQEELEAMHQELLEIRTANHRMQLDLHGSQADRQKMLLEKLQMEQQLQEQAGDLVEVERQLKSLSPRAFPGKHPGQLLAPEDSDFGPDTPPALPPARAADSNDQEAGHIVMAGGGSFLAYESLRKDFDAMMQELVLKKMELAELSEAYERVCHAFLKADESKNSPMLAKLKEMGPYSLTSGAQ